MTILPDPDCEVPGPGTPPSSNKASTDSTDILFKELVQQHASRLQRFIILHIGNVSDAEDLAQQAFMEAARSYQTFRGESQLSTWLYGIALNLVRNHLSRSPERRYRFENESGLEDMPCSQASPEESAFQAETMRLLAESLEELPESMRTILLLVSLDELSYEEAAALMNVPVGTVRSRLSRARTALRERLQAKGLTLNF